MSADALATLGASASTSMVLTPHSQNILSPASEELNDLSFAFCLVFFRRDANASRFPARLVNANKPRVQENN